MGKKFFFCSIAFWITFSVFEYYFLTSSLWFFWGFTRLGISILLLVYIGIQIIRIIRFRKCIKKIWIINLSILFLLLFFNININPLNKLVENIDWKILYSSRKSIVEKVIREEINPNVEWNNVTSRLSFRFPIVSVGGNNIWIDRHEDDTVSVFFYIVNGFFEWPITVFAFSNNNLVIENIEKHIKNDPQNNWKIKENWYRLFGRNLDFNTTRQ